MERNDFPNDPEDQREQRRRAKSKRWSDLMYKFGGPYWIFSVVFENIRGAEAQDLALESVQAFFRQWCEGNQGDLGWAIARGRGGVPVNQFRVDALVFDPEDDGLSWEDISSLARTSFDRALVREYRDYDPGARFVMGCMRAMNLEVILGGILLEGRERPKPSAPKRRRSPIQ